MEPKFQTSFIPKKPIISEPGSRVAVSHSINIFSAIATIVFALTILTSGGVFIYKNILESQILLSDKSLNAAREAFIQRKYRSLLMPTLASWPPKGFWKNMWLFPNF